MGSIDQTNTSFVPLNVGEDFTGLYASTTNFSEILISVETDTTFELVINFSSDNGTHVGIVETYTRTTPSTTALVYNVKPSLRYFQIVLTNTDATNQTYLRLTTILKSAVIYDPQEEGAVDANITNPYLITRIQGSNGETLAATNSALNTFITNTTDIPVDISGQTVNIGTLPNLNGLIVNISGQTVNISDQTVDISGQTVNISGQAVVVSGNVNIPHLNDDDDSILDSGVYKPTNDGVNSYFEISANPVNNVVLYYADETQGTDAVGGGWQFTSALHSGGLKRTKINWYMYQPKTDVVIGDLISTPTDTYYTIINNVGVEFPLIYIYTKPTVPISKITTGLGGSSWYQSKFVYQATQAGTAGNYLLYVGKDPVNIRNDIPHIQLSQFNALCQGTLQTNEIVMSASLQTSSALISPNGNFSLTMFKFGVIIEPVNTPIKVDANGALNVVIQNTAAIQVNSNTRDGAGNSITSTSSALDVNIKNSPLIVKDKPTYSVSLTDLSDTSQTLRTSAGCLNSFYIADIGGSGSAYVKFYNSSTAIAGDVSLMTIVLHKNTQVYINSSNMNFSSALCVRAVDDFSDPTTDPASGAVSITCFLSAYSE